MPPATISAKRISKTYQTISRKPGLREALRSFLRPTHCQIQALSGVDLCIRGRELVGLIGRNGAGKSSLLKILSGIMPPDTGEVRVLGVDPYHGGSAFKRRIALVMGLKSQLLWDLPPIESFRLHRIVYELSKEEFNCRLNELVRLLDVDTLLYRPVRSLSLGQQMMMEIVTALLHAPEVIFMDEPVLGIDLPTKKRVLDFLRGYCRQRRATVLYTSHVISEVKYLCDRTVIIDRGQVLYNGAIADLPAVLGGQRIIRVFSADLQPAMTLDFEPLRGAEISQGRLVARLPEHAVCQAQRWIAERFAVERLTVTEPDIEDVVAAMFDRQAQDVH
jgi:ABC-2 type transport system ATP-binding protein